MVLDEGSPDKQQLEGRLVEILHRISGADPASITPDALLVEDIGIDSLGYYEIKIEAETCFSIRIQEEQLLKFKTVGDVQSHLESLQIDSAHSQNT